MLLDFGMQMVLILVTGYAIALSAPVARLIDRLAAENHAARATVYLAVLVAGGLLVLVSWGWVVLAAVLGRELARRVRGVHYPFLVACAFLSSNAWVTGLSSSIPLLLNTPGQLPDRGRPSAGHHPDLRHPGEPAQPGRHDIYLVVAPTVMWLLRPRREPVEIDDCAPDGTGRDE